MVVTIARDGPIHNTGPGTRWPHSRPLRSAPATETHTRRLAGPRGSSRDRQPLPGVAVRGSGSYNARGGGLT